VAHDHELTVPQLYQACDLEALGCASSADLADLDAGLGQERALGALRFGIGIRHEGYNLYVMGAPGLGKHAIVRQLLGRQAPLLEAPNDWCYVNNFRTPHKPRVLRLPAGTGCNLDGDLRALVRRLIAALPAAFDSDEYRSAVQGIKDKFKSREEQSFGSVTTERPLVKVKAGCRSSYRLEKRRPPIRMPAIHAEAYKLSPTMYPALLPALFSGPS